MQWASAIATPVHAEDAIDEAAESVLAKLGGPPDLVVVFVSEHHAARFESIPAWLRRHFPEATLLGCSAGGCIGAGEEVEIEASVSVTAARLPDVTLELMLLEGDPRTWGDADLPDPESEPDLLVLAEPFSVDAPELLEWLDGRFPASTKIGGLASGAQQPGGHALFLNDEVYRSGVVGVALSGNIETDTIVSQGCRPIGAPMFVTRCQGSIIYELDGETAYEAMQRLYAELDPADQAIFGDALHLGVTMTKGEEIYEFGDFLIRNILGVDPDLGCLGVGFVPETSMVVQFHLRDAEASTEDLQELLTRHQYADIAGALLFSCVGRGRGLFGVKNHDTELFSQHLGPVPIGGFFSNGEIGPIQGRTFLHGYTSCFALFRPRR